MNATSPSENPKRGYVYVLTNEAMPRLVKIGVTLANDPQSRIADLYTTGVPFPFELVYAALTDDPFRVERALHNAFRETRVNPNREFFELDPDQAIGILQLLELVDYTESAREEVGHAVAEVDKKALERAKKRRPALHFHELGIPESTVLTFVDHEQTTVEVSRPRKVKLVTYPEGYEGIGTDDSDVSLWPLTRDLREFLFGIKNLGGPTGYWRLPDGQLLWKVYDQVHGPRIPQP